MKTPSFFKSVSLSALLFLNLVSQNGFAQAAAPPSFTAPASASTAGAATTPSASDDLFKSLDYPELQVVPRASERMSLEAEAEKSNAWYVNWMILVPSVMTFYAANTVSGGYRTEPPMDATQKLQYDNTVTFAQIVGVTGATLSVVMPMMMGYRDGLERVRSIKGNDRRAQLMRERQAEEILEKQAAIMNLVRYGVGAASFVAASSLNGQTSEQNKKYTILSMGLSLLPFFLAPKAVEVNRKHQEYKKKIYTPIAALGFGYDRKDQSLYPEYTLNWTF